jgi:hypothetical protein
MRNAILAITGSALIALSTVQLAAASTQHGRTHHRAHVGAQFRDTNAYAAPAYVPVQPESPGYGYAYSGGYSAVTDRSAIAEEEVGCARGPPPWDCHGVAAVRSGNGCFSATIVA